MNEENFDLSELSLNELITTNTSMTEFLKYLDESKIVIEKKEDEDDE
ncbi:MAG: hypothetical protein RSB77_06210 [Bacilli bacterium]